MFHHVCFQWCKNFPKNGKVQVSSSFFSFFWLQVTQFHFCGQMQSCRLVNETSHSDTCIIWRMKGNMPPDANSSKRDHNKHSKERGMWHLLPPVMWWGWWWSKQMTLEIKTTAQLFHAKTSQFPAKQIRMTPSHAIPLLWPDAILQVG